eukprot:gene42631-52876_t
MYTHSYAPLNQQYQTCKNDVLLTVQSQAGIAIGNFKSDQRLKTSSGRSKESVIADITD